MTTATFRTISCPASLWNWNAITSGHPPVNRLGFLRRLPVVRIQHKNHSSKSSGEQKWVTKGLITESLPNGMFSVRLENGDVVIGYTSGKMRCNKIRMMPGDKVEIEVSRYDSTRGRIVYRLGSNDF